MKEAWELAKGLSVGRAFSTEGTENKGKATCVRSPVAGAEMGGAESRDLGTRVGSSGKWRATAEMQSDLCFKMISLAAGLGINHSGVRLETARSGSRVNAGVQVRDHGD